MADSQDMVTSQNKLRQNADLAGLLRSNLANPLNLAKKGVVKMNFGEAIQAMKDGKRVCRKGWKTVWLAINNLEYGRPSFIYLGIDNAAFDKGHPWTPSQSELMAEDWEVKAEPPKNNKDMNMLLYFSLLMFFFALENLNKERDTYSPFCGKNKD